MVSRTLSTLWAITITFTMTFTALTTIAITAAAFVALTFWRGILRHTLDFCNHLRVSLRTNLFRRDRCNQARSSYASNFSITTRPTFRTFTAFTARAITLTFTLSVTFRALCTLTTRWATTSA